MKEENKDMLHELRMIREQLRGISIVVDMCIAALSAEVADPEPAEPPAVLLGQGDFKRSWPS